MRWIRPLLVLSAGIIALNFGVASPPSALAQSSGSDSSDSSRDSSSDESDEDSNNDGNSRASRTRRHATGTTTGGEATSQDQLGHSASESTETDQSRDRSGDQPDTRRSETNRSGDESSDYQGSNRERSSGHRGDDRPRTDEGNGSREDDRFDERVRTRTRSDDSDNEPAAGERNSRSSRNEDDETTRDRERPADSEKGRRDEMGAKFTTDNNDRLQVSSLESDSILARAGLRRGDIIRSVNGQRVASRESLDRWVHQANPTEPLALIILRDGRERTIHVDFAGQSQRNAYSYSNKNYSNNNDAHRAALGVLLDMRYSQDAIVQRVYRDSPADRAGIRPGDEITSINGQDIYSPQHLMTVIAELEPGTPVEVEYTRRVRRVTDVDLASRQVLHDRGETMRDNRIGRRTQQSSDESNYDSRETNDNSDESRFDSNEESE